MSSSAPFLGAKVTPEGTLFRVHRPPGSRLELIVQPPEADAELAPVALEPGEDGHASVLLEGVGAGARYWYLLDGERRADPASRFQPEGTGGPSEVVAADAYPWQDSGWAGPDLDRLVFYELHLGTFTPEGTWEAASRQLPELAELGITCVEVMPVNEFPGRFGWGYDGVFLFAPYHRYGGPDDARRFIDRAHALGLAVILDVVYNHLGPRDSVLHLFYPQLFTDRHPGEWGDAIDFDGPRSRAVRDFFVANAAYWVSELRFDGLRLDATHAIFDHSSPHILAEIEVAARRAAAPRQLLLVAEDEKQRSVLLEAPEDGGYGLDASWNDDFHHAVLVAASGRREGYCSDFLGTPQELVSALRHGFLYQGQRFEHWQGRRGAPALHLAPTRFVHYLQNHDQVANTSRGRRLHQLTSPGRLRALTTLLLLGPQHPLLFQGQEFASSSPFDFFADHPGELGGQVSAGRRSFLAQFRSLERPGAAQEALPEPTDEETFERCILDLSERERHATVYRLHRDLLALRRQDPVFSRPRHRGIEGAVLGPEAFVLRYLAEDGDDRLLLVNLGRDLELEPAPEPLLAPPGAAFGWRLLFSSEGLLYGGGGTPRVEAEGRWLLPGHCALVMAPAPG